MNQFRGACPHATLASHMRIRDWRIVDYLLCSFIRTITLSSMLDKLGKATPLKVSQSNSFVGLCDRAPPQDQRDRASAPLTLPLIAALCVAGIASRGESDIPGMSELIVTDKTNVRFGSLFIQDFRRLGLPNG
jgi:hypothetical protein